MQKLKHYQCEDSLLLSLLAQRMSIMSVLNLELMMSIFGVLHCPISIVTCIFIVCVLNYKHLSHTAQMQVLTCMLVKSVQPQCGHFQLHNRSQLLDFGSKVVSCNQQTYTKIVILSFQYQIWDANVEYVKMKILFLLF